MAGETRTRRELLKPGGSAAGSDTERLKRLLSVEQLVLYSYRHVLASTVLGPAARRALAPIPGYEQAHVRALQIQLAARRGGKGPPPPASDAEANRYLARRRVSGRLGQLQGERDALHTLLAVERVVVGAYFVALLGMEDHGLIVLATQIMASDAQHEAVLGGQLHPSDIPDAVPYGLVQGVQ